VIQVIYDGGSARLERSVLNSVLGPVPASVKHPGLGQETAGGVQKYSIARSARVSR
jgi:hypothetical protein